MADKTAVGTCKPFSRLGTHEASQCGCVPCLSPNPPRVRLRAVGERRDGDLGGRQPAPRGWMRATVAVAAGNDGQEGPSEGRGRVRGHAAARCRRAQGWVGSGGTRDRPERVQGGSEVDGPGPVGGQVEGDAAGRAGEPPGKAEEPPAEGFGRHDPLPEAEAGRPAGEVVGDHLDGKPGPVGGELPSRVTLVTASVVNRER